MEKEQFEKLQPGDIIRHVSGGEGLIVHGNYGGRITAVRVTDVTNPYEWDLILKVDYKRQK